ncbi:MAG: ATP-binding cassette domain-containing protein [Acidobacteria bacterium]|jgi:ABC-type dipeptide/oligopeptide/nickel transport system ATPase component|nr:ATP-binding cassette domain-containing protein [Acidobacteriota bacterium]
MILLAAQNLWVSALEKYPGGTRKIPLLQNAAIALKKNKITCLIGESGSGKTILAKTLAALLPKNVSIDQGNLIYKDQIMNYHVMMKLRGRGIFYSPQNAAASLNPVIKIKRQLEEIAPFKREQIPYILEDLDIDDPKRILNSYPFQLSGGEDQRCLMAMAVLMQPELLILDEPTSALDHQAKDKFIVTLKKMQNRFGFTILLNTHNLSLVRLVADYIYIILKGKIVEEGLPGNILTCPGHAYSQEILSLIESPKFANLNHCH